MTPCRLRAVDGKSDLHAATLRYLQLACLPHDEPMPTGEGWWWVAYDGALPVAFAGLAVSASVPGGGYLCRAGVLPSHRGRGLQTKLLAARERKARSVGLQVLVTDTFDNPHSSNNLVRAGFRMFDPPVRYGAVGTNYWRKPLPP